MRAWRGGDPLVFLASVLYDVVTRRCGSRAVRQHRAAAYLTAQ